MKHQLLHRPRAAVLGCPDFELVVMVEQQFSQIERVLGVVLGAAGDEGFTIFLERDGIDGIERDPLAR